MKRKLMFVAMTALVALGLIAPAVNADVTGTGVFEGAAQVGQHFRNAANTADIDCNKTTAKEAFARGQGLYLPPPAGPAPKNGVWSLHTTFTAVGTPVPPGMTTGSLDACGFLSKTVGGQGPACGISKGHSGLGQVNFNNGGGLNLFELQWKSSAGGTLPVTGKYQVWNGMKPPAGTKQKKNKWGNILAQVQAQGGVPCTQAKGCADQKTAPPGTAGCGAQSFTVAGTFELVQPGDRNGNGTPNEKKDVVRPKDNPAEVEEDNDHQDGPLCKDDGGDLGPCQFDPKKGNGKETPKPKPES